MVIWIIPELFYFCQSAYSKYHEMKEKHKAKLCQAKQKFDNETTWRDEKIKNLERKLSLCSHSLAKVNMQFCPTLDTKRLGWGSVILVICSECVCDHCNIFTGIQFLNISFIKLEMLCVRIILLDKREIFPSFSFLPIFIPSSFNGSIYYYKTG